MNVIATLISLLLAAGCSAGLSPAERIAEREEVKRDVIAELRAQSTSGPVMIPAGVLPGVVEGRVLRRGQPLLDCRVRLVRLEERPGLFGLGRDYVPADVLESKTGRDGLFRFERVPVGRYKVKWTVPGGDSWIRILSPEPDLAVGAGKTTTFRDIDMARGVLGE